MRVTPPFGPKPRPPCWNRPPHAPTVQVNDALSADGRQLTREIAYVFVDECASWKGSGIGPNGEPYPLAVGWDCTGCRLLPANLGPTPGGS